MKKPISAAALALVGTTLLLSLANAQTTNTMLDDFPPGDSIGTTGNLMMTGDADRQFLLETAWGSIYDRAVAELAVQKAGNKSVQRYALRVLDEHNNLHKMLLLQANKRGIVLPLTMRDDDKDKLQNLMDADAGDEFDVAYLKEALRINAEDVRKSNDASNASQDSQFRNLMRDYANTEQNHLNSASKILSSLQKQSGAMNNGIMKKANQG